MTDENETPEDPLFLSPADQLARCARDAAEGAEMAKKIARRLRTSLARAYVLEADDGLDYELERFRYCWGAVGNLAAGWLADASSLPHVYASIEMGVQYFRRALEGKQTVIRAIAGFPPELGEEREDPMILDVDPADIAATKSMLERWSVNMHLLAQKTAAHNQYVPTTFERAILKALAWKSLTKAQISEAVKANGKRLNGALSRLMEQGLISNSRGLGYYRADAPPPLP